MKLRNVRAFYKSVSSQITDTANREGMSAYQTCRAARRRRCGGRANRPLFRGEPVLSVSYKPIWRARDLRRMGWAK